MDDHDDRAALLKKLAEANQALAAVRAGKLDVLVADTKRLYTRPSAERIYRLIVEGMLEGAVTVSDAGIVLYCNPGFARMVGLPPSEALGKPVAPWLIGGDVTVKQLVTGGDPVRGDFELVAASGTRIPISVFASSIDDGDQTVRCLVMSDLRPRETAARLREHKAKLEAASDRKDEFLAILGHELRNPLAPIRQAAELLDARAGPNDPEYVRQARTVLARQVAHLSRIVDDLLDAGRISQGTLVIRPESIDLRDVIENAVESVDRLIQRRGHTLCVHLPSTEVRCRGDTVRLTQVVANLLSNAAKYTPDHGRVDVSLESDSQWAMISVKDTGRGIVPELLPHLFDPFVRGETTIDRQLGGLGVGLTLVQRLVELHEGRVEAASQGPGSGSEFRVTLPVEMAQAPAVERQTGAAASPAKILVVDDNEDAADMLTLVLRARGHHVVVAYDGEEALDRDAELEPDVVCLDIGLPRMDGYEVARRIRARRGAAVTLIALTGYGRDEDLDQARAAGFDHHFVKPVAADEVEGVVAGTREMRHPIGSDEA